MSTRRLFIAGASGHAKVVCDAIRSQNKYEVAGFVDPELPKGARFFGYRVLGRDDDIGSIISEFGITDFIVAVGDNFRRKRIANHILNSHPGLNFVSVFHASSVIAPDAVINAGTVIMANAVINAGSRIGTGCIVNTGASVDHDCDLGDFVAISPGARLGGDCSVDSGSFVGIGATVTHGTKIGSGTVVGAGSVVVQNLGDNVVAFGNPAKSIRSRTDSESFL